MASQDFIELMTKLYVERYSVISTHVDFQRAEVGFSAKAKVELEKNGKQVTVESADEDFIRYIFELRQIADTTGDAKFVHIKRQEQYDADVEHLIDADKSKLVNAINELKSGKFKFTYDFSKLIEDFLSNERNVKNRKFLPLKKDYYYILASSFAASKEVQKAYKEIKEESPQAKKKFVQGIDSIMRGFWITGNAIKDYRYYRNYLTFDIGELARRVSTQIPVIADIRRGFIEHGGVDVSIAIPKVMNLYARILELLKPALHLLRIGLELRRGNPAPDKNYTLAENLKILKSDREYGQLFNCLDEQIRHADAHASFHIDKTEPKIYLMDSRVTKEKVVKVYTFDEFTGMMNVMNNQFLPVIYPTIVLFDVAMLDLVLVSKEYKFLLLALGNY